MSELLINLETNPWSIYPQEISKTQDGGLAHKPKAPLLLGSKQSEATCPFCYALVKTRVKYVSTTRTHIAAALWFWICCCCCIPYCLSSAKNTDHYCPNCHRYMGTYKK